MIIETDLGGDPDDLFAILFLAHSGIKIDLLALVPGDGHQIQIAEMLRTHLDLDFQIGVWRDTPRDSKPEGLYKRLLEKYPVDPSVFYYGKDSIFEILNESPQDILTIGPPRSVGLHVKTHGTNNIRSLVMQGGFAPYHLFKPTKPVQKLTGLDAVQSFNPNGDPAAFELLASSDIPSKRIVGKNVCHSVVMNEDQSMLINAGFYRDALDEMGRKRKDKKFHDVVAAMACVHPEIMTWIKGTPRRKVPGGWFTMLDENGCDVCVDIDHEKFWGIHNDTVNLI